MLSCTWRGLSLDTEEKESRLLPYICVWEVPLLTRPREGRPAFISEADEDDRVGDVDGDTLPSKRRVSDTHTLLHERGVTGEQRSPRMRW